MNEIKCIVVDDEPIARDIIVSYSSHMPMLKVVAICSNAMEAKSILEQQTVDIIFLDIDMPVLSGLAFLRTLTRPPRVIFTTAYREFAVEAFELSAADYLLKPFSLERFIIAVDKARAQIRLASAVTEPSQNSSGETEQPVFIKSDGKIYRLTADEILFAEANGNYCKIMTTTGVIMPAMSFTSLITMLKHPAFIRTHRSFLINKSHIRLIDGNRVFIRNNEVPIGQSFKDDFTAARGL